MNDLRDDLQELFRRREGDVRGPLAAPPPVIRRTRRRQVVNVVGTALGLAALVLVPFGLLRLSPSGDTDQPVGGGQVELPVAPEGFRSAALPYASIAYPEGWYLTDPSPLTWMGIAQPARFYSGPVLQLSNFDPDLHDAPRCMFDADPIPDDGVLLTVGVQAPEDTNIPAQTTAWPVELGPYPPNTDPQCEQGENLTTGWVAPSGASYWANATIGADAPGADRSALVAAFASLHFPPTPEPWMTTFAADQGQGSPRLVLDTATFHGQPLTLVVFLDHYKVVSIGVSAPDDRTGSCCLGGSSYVPGSGSGPPGPVESTMNGAPDGAVVYGDASLDVVRAEIRTDEAATFPATLVQVPETIGFDRQLVWGFVEGTTSHAQAIGYDAVGHLLGDPIVATDAPEVIASGDDPLAGHWEAAITHDTMGDGMTLTTASGGGGWCCLMPDRLEGVDLALSGTGSTGDGPSTVEALVTPRVARVEAAMTDGKRFEAMLFPFPDGYVGPAQYVLVFIPPEVELRGDLVAYAETGEELARETIGEGGGSSGTLGSELPWENVEQRLVATGRSAGTPWRLEIGYFRDGIRLTIGGRDVYDTVIPIDRPIVRAVDGDGLDALLLVLTDTTVHGVSVMGEGSWDARWMPASTPEGDEARLWLVELPGAGAGTLAFDGEAAGDVRWP